MENLYDNLKTYLENTSQEVLEKEWKELEYLNEIGPDVLEYASFVKVNYSNEFECSCQKNIDSPKFCLPMSFNDNGIAIDSSYCLAA